MNPLRCAGRLILILTLCCLCACTGQGGDHATRPLAGEGLFPLRQTPELVMQPGPDGSPALLPGLPPDGAAPSRFVTANGADMPKLTEPSKSAGAAEAQDDPGTVVIIPVDDGDPDTHDDEWAYAMYSFSDRTLERPVALSMTVAPAKGGDDLLPLRYWIGLSDYTQGNWFWLSQGSSDPDLGFSVEANADGSRTLSFTMNSDSMRERFTSITGEYHILIATGNMPAYVSSSNTTGACGVKVRACSVDIEPNASLKPTFPHITSISGIDTGSLAQPSSHGKSASAATGAPSATIEWDHLFDPDNDMCEAISYGVYRQLWLPKEHRDAEKISLGQVLGGGAAKKYVDPNETQVSDGNPGPIPGAQYVYYLRAFGNSGWSAFSQYFVDIPLLPPDGFKASQGEYAERIELSWTKGNYDEWYRISRDGTALPDIDASSLPGPDCTWVDDSSTATDDLIHTYTIQVGNQYKARGAETIGWGDISDPVEGYTSQLLAPANVSASDGTFIDRIEISWAAVANATSYEIYRGPTIETGVLLSANAASPYLDSTVPDDSIHTYWVRGVGNGGRKGAPGSDTGFLDTLDPPGSVQASDAGFYDRIHITWGAVAGAAKYEVYRDSQGGALLATVDAPALAYDDLIDPTVKDGSVHQYWVRAMAAPAIGQYGGPDDGSILRADPIADISPDVMHGEVPFDIAFDANGSVDPDQAGGGGDLGIIKYEFDFGEGGGWKVDGVDDGLADGMMSHTYTERGRFTARVRVTDDESKSNTASVEVGEWRGDWWCFQHDRQHTGISTYAGPITNTGGPLTWSGYLVSGGVVIGAGGEVYFTHLGSDPGGNLVCLDSTGAFDWSYATNSNKIPLTPAIGVDGTIFFTCNNGKCYAVNPDGSEKWVYTPSGGGVADDISAPALGADGTVYFTSATKVFALNPANGNDHYGPVSVPLSDYSYSTPAVDMDGNIYFGTRNAKKLVALHADLSPKWVSDYTATNDLRGAPMIQLDTNGDIAGIYICAVNDGNDDGHLIKYNSIGEKVWDSTVGANPNGIAVCCPVLDIGGGIVYAWHQGNNDKSIYRFNVGDGTRKLVYATAGRTEGQGIVGANGYLYIGDTNATMYCIDPTAQAPEPTGQVKWSRSSLDSDSMAPGAIGPDGAFWFGVWGGGHMYRIGP